MDHVDMLLERAIAGDATSCFLLACEYEHKGGGGDIPATAYYWMRRAALKKHPWALTNLGVYCERGYGTQQDVKKAFVWWKRAVAFGSVAAMFNMGLHLLYGDGVRKNYRKAVLYLTQVVASAPLPQAYFLLGQCYEFGWGVQKDKTIAFDGYREAAVLGDANAIWRLGVFSYYGIVCEQNNDRAMQSFELAAKMNHTKAQLCLAICLLHRPDLPNNKKQALMWIKRATRQGSPEAQKVLGFLYAIGHGVPQNRRLARKWYLRAIASGDVEAQHLLDVLPTIKSVTLHTLHLPSFK